MEQVTEKTQRATPYMAERLAIAASGKATIAEAAGINKKQLYEIAEKGYLLFSQGKLEDARRIYEGLVAADPFDSVFHCHLGAVLWRSGDTERAFEEYDAAVRFNIANVDALAGRGELLIARGEIEKGFVDLSRALENDPKCLRPSAQRARALLFSMSEAAKAKRQA